MKLVFALVALAGCAGPTAAAVVGQATTSTAAVLDPLVVSRHTVIADGDPAADRHRAFVVVPEPIPDRVAWEPLAPRGYDTTRIAEAPPAAPRTFTLVGRHGACVVTSARRVYLDRAWPRRAPASVAYEIEPCADGHQIAVAGAHPALELAFATDGERAPAAHAWLEARGIEVIDGHAFLHGLPGTDLDAVWAYVAHRDDMTTYLRRGDELVRELPDAVVVGVLRDGARQVLIVHDDRLGYRIEPI
jgi:hypothetical protein